MIIYKNIDDFKVKKEEKNHLSHTPGPLRSLYEGTLAKICNDKLVTH